MVFASRVFLLICAIGVGAQAAACSSPGPLLLSPAVRGADLVAYGSLTGQSVYERVRVGRSSAIEVSTVVFDVERILFGESPAVLEFIALENADTIVRNLGEHFVVVLVRAETPIFVADDSFAGALALPILMQNNCGNYMFRTSELTDLSSRFLFEIFDGDGDPGEEAAVFDRFLRGIGLF